MSASKHLWVAALVGLVLCPTPAWAHARLTRSEPASGSRVGSPQIIRLWFSERPEVALTGVTVTNGSGRIFAVSLPQPNSSDPLEVSFAVSASLPAGKYKLAWRTVASDGHPSRGSFTFVVLSTPSAVATESLPLSKRIGAAIQSADTGISFDSAEVEQADGSASVSGSLARAFSFGGILMVIGVIVFNVLVVARSDRIGGELVWRMESRAAVVGIAASILVIIAGFGRIYLESRMMSEMPGMQAMSMTDTVMHTRWGFALRLEIIAAFLALIAFAIAIPRVRGAWLIASLSAVVLAFTPALAGHAAATPRFTSMMTGIDFLHVLGASSWLGNLACVMLIGVPIVQRNGGAERWQSVATLVNTFSPIANASATVVVLSGLTASWVHLERVSDLWTTAYGQMLFRKLVLVAITLVIGAYNFRMVQPQLLKAEGTVRLRRWTAMELGLGVIIILITGFLTGIAP